MARRPRIEIPGYYHVLNRGVERRKIFHEPKDYRRFETLMCTYAKKYAVTIHNKIPSSVGAGPKWTPRRP